MNQDDLTAILAQFLANYHEPGRSVLLGLSGGPDSLALLHLLLPHCVKRGMKLHVAHLDHDCHPESAAEAAYLRDVVVGMGIPWHSKRLSREQFVGNVEAFWRTARQDFFHEICLKHNCQAVLLGHHADDQAETVLKRLFEGAWLPYLSGLRCNTMLNGLTIWRPLLHVRKKTILDWLERHSIVALDDYTNRDTRFMRPRCREWILPQLRQQFGKDITMNLCRLGHEAQELHTYMEEQVQRYITRISTQGMGIFADQIPQNSFERRYFVRTLLQSAQIEPFYQSVGTICSLLQDGKANKKVCIASDTVYIDRGTLFIPHRELPSLPKERQSLAEGCYGNWQIAIEPIHNSSAASATWQEAIRGRMSIDLPDGMYEIGPADPRCMRSFWETSKVPTYARALIPAIWRDDVCLFHYGIGTKSMRLHLSWKGIS